MGSLGRQTVLREFAVGFPFQRAKQANGSVNHVVHSEDLQGNIGPTYCARWSVAAKDIETELDVLNVARNLCTQCARRMDESHRETLAVMASVNTQKHITPDDIL